MGTKTNIGGQKEPAAKKPATKAKAKKPAAKKAVPKSNKLEDLVKRGPLEFKVWSDEYAAIVGKHNEIYNTRLNKFRLPPLQFRQVLARVKAAVEAAKPKSNSNGPTDTGKGADDKPMDAQA